MSAIEVESVSAEPLWFVHYLVRVHISAEMSNGEFTLMEMKANRFDSPLHIHHNESETFYVLEGTMRVNLPGRTIELNAGDAFFTPLGVPQMYQVVSDSARWLVLTSPGGFDRHIVSNSVPAERPEIPPGFTGQGPLPSADRLAKSGHEILGPSGTMPPAA